jgi:hypothetical protein
VPKGKAGSKGTYSEKVQSAEYTLRAPLIVGKVYLEKKAHRILDDPGAEGTGGWAKRRTCRGKLEKKHTIYA